MFHLVIDPFPPRGVKRALRFDLASEWFPIVLDFPMWLDVERTCECSMNNVAVSRSADATPLLPSFMLVRQGNIEFTSMLPNADIMQGINTFHTA